MWPTSTFRSCCAKPSGLKNICNSVERRVRSLFGQHECVEHRQAEKETHPTNGEFEAMSTSARVFSVDALVDLKATLCTFTAEAREALSAVEMEIRRNQVWLDGQLAHWRDM